MIFRYLFKYKTAITSIAISRKCTIKLREFFEAFCYFLSLSLAALFLLNFSEKNIAWSETWGWRHENTRKWNKMKWMGSRRILGCLENVFTRLVDSPSHSDKLQSLGCFSVSTKSSQSFFRKQRWRLNLNSRSLSIFGWLIPFPYGTLALTGNFFLIKSTFVERKKSEKEKKIK